MSVHGGDLAVGSIIGSALSSFCSCQIRHDAKAVPMCRKTVKARLSIIWCRFIRRQFASAAEVEQVLGCGKSTAYRWFDGDVPGADLIVWLEHEAPPTLARAWREAVREGLE